VQELELIRELLAGGTTRLLTLTGPAGVGKTRLALEAARRLADDFTDGVVFTDLTAVDDPLEVATALAAGLGPPDAGPTPPLERIAERLRARETLLILDNFEKVLSAAPLLDALLAASPDLKLLVTSRELLHLRSEQSLPVPPFPLPDPDHLPPIEALAEVPSVALFLQRARRTDPSFRLSPENAPAVAELVVRLDGLPLAIELAAARIQLLSPQMMLERLEQRLSLLHWEAQDLPERQHTLRSAISWSYDLLSDDEQVLFRRLGIFVGGFTLDAAEGVAPGAPHRAIGVLEGLASLVDKSLVLKEADREGGYRFHLLESVRDYALEQVTSCEDIKAVARAYARYFLALAERAAPELVGPAQRAWFLRLEREHENLRFALRWFLNDGDDVLALRLAAALGYFWEVRGYLREGQQAREEALARVPDADPRLRARVPDADPRLRARVLNRLGSLLLWQGETERSRVAVEQSLDMGRALEDRSMIARSLTHLGRRANVAELSEESGREATRLMEEALALRQQMGDRRGAANNQTQLGWLALSRGDHDHAEHFAQEALATYQEVDDQPRRRRHPHHARNNGRMRNGCRCRLPSCAIGETMNATTKPNQDTITDIWPALPYEEWKDTMDTLHMWTQIVGKVKLEFEPFLNEWWQVGFTITARGLTTSTIPFGRRVFQVDFDFIDHRLDIHCSDGSSRSVPLLPRSVADFYQEVMATLDSLGVQVKINTTPQEVENTIPFDQDHEHASYDPAYVTRWWRILLQVERLLQQYRTPFVGKSSPVLFWWGTFDLSETRFSGRPAPKREWPTRWMAIGAEREQASAGFWPGSGKVQEPAFYAYTYPEPPGHREAVIHPDAAFYHPELSEFILPYDQVRKSPSPDQLILAFFRSTYEFGATLGGWDRAALERPDPIGHRQAEIP
jgi:predicted ATPase